MPNRPTPLRLLLSALGVTAALALLAVARPVAAASFDPNRLLRDEDLTDYASMSEAQIQAFLVAQGSCLATIDPVELGKRDGQVKVANTRSAAGIIYDAANGIGFDGTPSDYKVNPQVLLVTLQKEYSLITNSCSTLQGWYGTNFLTKAVGYDVPDVLGVGDCLYTFRSQILGATCSGDAYLGAAKAYRRNFDQNKVGPGGSYPWPQSFSVPTTSSAGSGNTTVTPFSKATSLLYRYTPYVYNGNYNFFNTFNGWFGTAPAEITSSAVDTHGGIVGVDTRATLSIRSLGLSDTAFSVAIVARRKDAAGNYSQNYDFGTSSVNTMSYGDVRTVEFSRALPAGDYQLYAATYYRGEWLAITNLVRSFTVRPAAVAASVSAKDYYRNGGDASISVTLTNNEAFRIYLSQVGMAARLDGRNVDFPVQAATYLDPGQARSFTFTRRFDAGTVTYFPIYRVDTADWLTASPRADGGFGSWPDGIYRLRASAITLDQPTAYYDQPSDFRFTLTNPTAEDITVPALRIAGRRFGSENFDFGLASSVTVPAGSAVPIHFRTVTGKSGDFQFWPIYLSGNGVDWVSFKPADGVAAATQFHVY